MQLCDMFVHFNRFLTGVKAAGIPFILATVDITRLRAYHCPENKCRTWGYRVR